MSSEPIVIIGAGMGGLALAARLAHRGESVIILEKTDQIGGRNRRVSVQESQFDGGPTLMMMLDPFQKLFSDLETRLEEHLQITLCDPSYRAFYRDGTRIDATPNVAKMLRQIEQLSGPRDAAAYPKLLGQLGELYHASIPTFVRNSFNKPSSFLGPKAIYQVLKHQMLGNLYKKIDRTMEDERLKMLFSFQTMYLGLSPYDAPWVYATLTYMEYGDGIWYPKGGLPAISEAIARIAESKGVQIRLNSSVQSIQENKVVLESGEIIAAKAVITNADLPYSDRALNKRPAKTNLKYSCSAYVLYLHYRGALPNLLHHNVFFGRDFKKNLDAIFHTLERPEDPAFYACISKRSDASRAPEGYENLFILIPCANLDRPWNEEEAAALRSKVFQRLAEEVGFEESKIVEMKSTSPQNWKDVLNLEKGAAFGLSHEFRQSAFFRPGIQNRHNKHLYYVGASTTPGNGLPMVLISAELVEQRLVENRVIR